MPGIVGIICKKPGRSFEKVLSLMLASMSHETFYTSGSYVDDTNEISIGWVCRKGSFPDCLPIWNETKDSCLFFYGEDFTDKDAIEKLRIQGHEFDSSNASYLIHLYEEKGDDFIRLLNGRFHGVLLDHLKHKIILFNDRYGMQRIYYHEKKDVIYFSSEAKTLLKALPELRNINMKSAGEYFSCGCVLEDRSLFSDIYLLPGGSKWTFNGDGIGEKEIYFNYVTLENYPSLHIDSYYEKLRDTFTRILPRYFRSREPIGMSMTGGLDTRMILSNIDLEPGALPFYTFGSIYRDSADVAIARKIADLYHQTYQTIQLGKEYLSEFPDLAERTVFISDGSLDVSGSTELYANRLAREIAPVRMTGNYGSEVLRSNIAFKPTLPCENLFDPDLYVDIRNAGKTFDEMRKIHPLSFILTRQTPWHHYGRFSLEQSQLTVRSPFLDNELVELVYQAPPEALVGNDLSLRLISDGNSALSEIMTDRGVGGNSSQMYGLLKRMVQNFTFKAEYAFDYGMPQWVASIEHIFMSLHLEKIFLGRHKFYHFRIWYRDELSDYVQEILSDRRTNQRPYFDKTFLKKMVQGHRNGDRNYTREIHQAISMELIHRLFIDN